MAALLALTGFPDAFGFDFAGRFVARAASVSVSCKERSTGKFDAWAPRAVPFKFFFFERGVSDTTAIYTTAQALSSQNVKEDSSASRECREMGIFA